MCPLTLLGRVCNEAWIQILLESNEYLGTDLPLNLRPGRIFMSAFDLFHRFRAPESTALRCGQPDVAGHRPLAMLAFWLLARAGLGGAILGRGRAHTRRLGGRVSRYRRPLRVLVPGTVPGGSYLSVALLPRCGLDGSVGRRPVRRWAVSGPALASIGAARGRILGQPAWAVCCSVLAAFLSYGLLLFGLVVLLALLLIHPSKWVLRQVVGPWSDATAGFIAVVGRRPGPRLHWVSGSDGPRVRYHEGIGASARSPTPFTRTLAAAGWSARSPLLAIAVSRSIAALIRGHARSWTQDRVVARCSFRLFLVALVADFFVLSKAETERIWLLRRSLLGSWRCSGAGRQHGPWR